ncbi:hypothetical protein [Ktedonobacter racemifer]|uniref:hypothetical protein n=1 Tax=Ktedonobacter racemifer TaxID=363277 RepID=UPI0012F90739|nr:hypothetical protein [Ktedonobacter racemifer]
MRARSVGFWVNVVACLNAQSTLPQHERLGPSAREELLTALFDLWKFGYNYGGIGEDVAEALAEHATAQERKSIEAWIREELRPGQDFSSKWHNRHLIDFLATLKQAEHFNDEDVLEEYRKVGLYKEMAEKCLQLGRQQEALAIAQANLTEPMDVTWFAEQLVKAGEIWRDPALAFVEMRLGEVKPALPGKSQDFTNAQTVETYRRWLGEKYLLYGQAKQATDMELERFQANPDHTTYRSVRSAALATGQPGDLWPTTTANPDVRTARTLGSARHSLPG